MSTTETGIHVRTFRELGQQIAARELPAFGSTLREIFRASEGDDLSGQQLAEVILRDPALTSRLLRAANAAHLGRSGDSKVATVSRAVVVLGINSIRSLCASAITVESMSTAEGFRRRVQETLGRTLHAAVQARDLGVRQRVRRDEAERLFVAALLSRIGEMAFWCHGQEFARRLDDALERQIPLAVAEQTILGTSLSQFGRELLRAWNLDGVLHDGETVGVALHLARAAQRGWTTADAQQAVRGIAVRLGQPEDETRQRLEANAHQAALLAAALGAPEASRCIPSPTAASAPGGGNAARPETNGGTQEPGDPAPDRVERFPQPDLAQQWRILAEMAHVAASRKDLPMLFGTCLEGLHRAVGLDRCVLCLLTPAQTRLVARMSAGIDPMPLRGRLQWDWTPALEAELGPRLVRSYSAQNPPPEFLLSATGVADCLVATLSADQKVIGLVYADRQPSTRPLSEEAFEGFRCFVVQTELVMRALPPG